MELIDKCQSELYTLSKTSNKEERALLLKKFDDCVIDAISEISKNCLIDKIPLTQCNFKKIKAYKATIRKLSKKNIPSGNKRALIVQQGGFLNILIPSVLSLLANEIEKNETSSYRRK